MAAEQCEIVVKTDDGPGVWVHFTKDQIHMVYSECATAVSDLYGELLPVPAETRLLLSMLKSAAQMAR